eukprot:s763_g2.t1
MDSKSSDGQQGQYKRFSGAALDGKELRKWRLWCEAKMASQKDMESKQRGPWVFTLLDGLALETVEHLTIDTLTKENGDKEIWKLLEERFPDKLQHDLLAECLKEVSVDFPAEARGWVALNCSGLSADQRAIVTAKSGGDLKFETVVSSLRSCFPDYVANSKSKKVSPVMVVAHHDEVEDEPQPVMDGSDAVVFEEVEAFLSEHGIQHTEVEPGEFDEIETAEILAATWKERRTEIAKLQRSRNFRQAVKVQQQFKEDVSEVKKRSSKGSGSSDKSLTASGAAMVIEKEPKSEDLAASASEEVLLENLFAFGNNKEELTQFVAELPIGINGKINSAGQFVIDIMDFPTSGSGSHETLMISNDEFIKYDPVQNPVNVTEYVVPNIPHECHGECHEHEHEQEIEIFTGETKSLTRREQRCVMSRHTSWSKGHSKCAVAELFSPPRFALAAQERGADGLSFDIKHGWNLIDKKVQHEVSGLLESKRPELLVLCPECKHWGGWYRLNQHKLPMWEQIHKKQVAEKQALFCVAEAKRQIKRGGRVLIEHPWSSGLWEFAPMKKLLKQMHLCKASMCAYGLKCPDTDVPILKPTHEEASQTNASLQSLDVCLWFEVP